MHKDLGKVKVLALVLGFIYSAFVGVLGFSYPINLQATIVGLVLALAFGYLAMSQRRPHKLVYFLLVTTGVLALYFAITTSQLLFYVNNVVFLVAVSLLVVSEFKEGRMPQSAWEYVLAMGEFGGEVLKNIFKPVNIKTFFLLPKLPRIKLHLTAGKLTGMFLALPILLIFHLLFASVNTEYARFMADFLKEVWRVIKYIIDIEIIWIILKGLLNGYLFFVVFSVVKRFEPANRAENKIAEIFSVVVSLSIVLFAVFSFFQSKLIFTNFSTLPFKDVSMYAQNGFWELIAISVFGYSLFLIAQNTEIKIRKTFILLTLFLTELIFICIFSYHKLFILQVLFGLKDQRILATLAVTLIIVTFLLSLGRIWGKVTSKTLFFTQVILLISSVISLNMVNLDAFISRTHPIGYYINDNFHKDYAYLLGNSFDNYTNWPKLIQDFKLEGLHLPQDTYYWGWYSSPCDTSSLFGPRASGWYAGEPFIVNKHRYIQEKYADFSLESKKLHDLAQFNLTEYQAYRLIQGQPERFQDFGLFLTQACASEREKPPLAS